MSYLWINFVCEVGGVCEGYDKTIYERKENKHKIMKKMSNMIMSLNRFQDEQLKKKQQKIKGSINLENILLWSF